MKFTIEDYPGQAFYHEHNPRIRATELAWSPRLDFRDIPGIETVRVMTQGEVDELRSHWAGEEFCRYCGAGKGAFRREDEGTCVKCDPPKSGGTCKNCGGTTTYKRQNTHGLCMKCELERGQNGY